MHDLNIFFNSKYVPMARGLRYNCPSFYFVSPGIFQIMQIFLENKEMGGVCCVLEDCFINKIIHDAKFIVL